MFGRRTVIRGIGVSLLLIALGVFFDDVAFSEPVRGWTLSGVLAWAVILPFGVILDMFTHDLRLRAGHRGI